MPPSQVRSSHVAIVLTWLLIALPRIATGQQQLAAQDLKALSIEELTQVDVTLPTRQPEPVGLAAAAMDVITRDQIRRSGVRTIADAIAMADSVHVARFNNGTWAVSTRGFNATSANKLLVMVDGRTEYSSLFTGTFWNTLDYVLDDIDRIEVIRGPGATLWGANAVNGVVNIITRHSRDTQGTYVAIGSGNEDPALFDVRYGGAAGAATYRVYGKFAQRDAQAIAGGESADDTRRRGQAGFRIDAGTLARGTWLVEGDFFRSRDEFFDRPSGEFTNAALSGGWSRAYGSMGQLDVRGYYRREDRRIPLQLTHSIDTVDADLQHAMTWRDRHRLVWGGGYRVNFDRTEGGTVRFDPPQRTYGLLSAFAQDEIAVRPDLLYVTAGLKMERNTFSGAEWQPNARVRVQLRRQVVWGAVSRAMRRPTRLDVDVRAFTPTDTLVAVGGGDAFRAEELVATEVGYRAQPHRLVAVGATVFAHRYDDLRSQELPPSGPPIVVGNTLNGRSQGLELSVTLEPVPILRIRGSYTHLDVSIDRDPGSRDVGLGASEANDPRHLLTVRTAIDLSPRTELDVFFRRIGELSNPLVPGYAELNARVGWRVTPRFELSVTGQDLLHAQHPEFGALLPRRVEFQRSVRALLAFRH